MNTFDLVCLHSLLTKSFQIMSFKFFIFVSLIVGVNSLSPKSQYFNISQQVLDISWNDMALEARFDLQYFLCKVCDQLVEVAKVYVRNNKVLTGEQLIGFMTNQQYFQEAYVCLDI